MHYDDLFEALGLDGVPVIGHSFGGMIAAELAPHYPHRVVEARPDRAGRALERRRTRSPTCSRRCRPSYPALLYRRHVAPGGTGDAGRGRRRAGRRGARAGRAGVDDAGEVHVADPGPRPARDACGGSRRRRCSSGARTTRSCRRATQTTSPPPSPTRRSSSFREPATWCRSRPWNRCAAAIERFLASD